MSPPAPAPPLDCAAAVAQDLQGATINQVVAAIEKLPVGTCAWMGTYSDLDAGTMRPVPADPAMVAGIAGLHRNAVAPFGGRAAPEAA